MKIYLIRHTQPDVEKGICYGSSDLDVAATFEAEAAARNSGMVCSLEIGGGPRSNGTGAERGRFGRQGSTR